MYRTPAAEIIPPSFCHITFFHGTSHLPSGSGNDCMHECSHWVNHQSGWPEIYSLFATPRAYGQLSTCGFWLRVDETDPPHPEAKPVWRDQFTGAGRRTATRSYFNSMQTYSNDATLAKIAQGSPSASPLCCGVTGLAGCNPTQPTVYNRPAPVQQEPVVNFQYQPQFSEY